MMYKIRTLFVMLLLTVFTLAAFTQKPRILITTDIGGDPDDQQSLVRFMLYTNEFDVEGFVSSASGTPGELKEEIVHPELIVEIIQAYEEVYPNLMLHDKGYTSPQDLISLVKKGNPQRGWENVGEGNDTEGSRWIVQVVDKKDSRPLNICIFGGQTDLAQALWKVKSSRSEKDYRAFISKIRVFDINDQDHIFDSVFAEHPDLFYILAKAPAGVDKREGAYRGMYLGGDENLTSLAWLKENVLENHGPLGALYPQKTWTAPNPYSALKEGDTPSWFFFLKNGLQDPDHPEYGGWGGRYAKNSRGFFSDARDQPAGQDEQNARATVYRWRDDFQREFAARMDWCVQDHQSANHAPEVSVNGSSDREVYIIREKPGKMLKLDASECIDPDGDQLTFEWMPYPEAGKLDELPGIKIERSMATLAVPEFKPGSSLHLVLKVSDLGSPVLSAYKRIIIQNK